MTRLTARRGLFADASARVYAALILNNGRNRTNTLGCPRISNLTRITNTGILKLIGSAVIVSAHAGTLRYSSKDSH